MKILKILFFISILFCLYSCGGSHNSDEPTTTTSDLLYTSKQIWIQFHCKINDTRNIARILPYYTKDARYLFGRKGGFWIQKFTLDGDSIWDTVLKDGYSAYSPILLSNGNIAIAEVLDELGERCFPIIISESNGNAKIINQSDINIANINSYTNFFICNHDPFFTSYLDNLQIDNDGNIIRRGEFDNIPEGNSYLAISDNYVRKEFTYWIDNKEYISVTNSIIRRANLDRNIWNTSTSLIPDVSKADISITIKNNVIIVKYNCSGEEMMRKFNYTTGKMINDVDNPEGDGKDMPNG